MAQLAPSRSTNVQLASAKKRPLGLWASMALVTGSMIGSGVFLLPASLAPYGSISIVGWGLTAIGAMLLALLFAKLSSMVPRVGGPYAYTRLFSLPVILG